MKLERSANYMKRKIKEDIALVGKRLYERRLNGGYGGNISVRDGDVIYITPTGVPKDILEYSEILVMDFKGNIIEGEGKPSSEMLFHIILYKERPDVNAIIHAHPPLATGFAIARHPITEAVHEEAAIILGKVPVIPYEITSSKELAKSVGEAFKNANAVLLANHGAITAGDTLEKAFRRMEELENLCEMLLVADALGGAKKIPLKKLFKLFEIMKIREGKLKI
jgi:L-fuculose-phosphate aldolase